MLVVALVLAVTAVTAVIEYRWEGAGVHLGAFFIFAIGMYEVVQCL